ncbi:MAG: hypothetical protein N3E37_03320 [Candidatus Micrarchaeota archaeon]|nr:hypothetical protein [Candidatus Micrarchaeota archaeon]
MNNQTKAKVYYFSTLAIMFFITLLVYVTHADKLNKLDFQKNSNIDDVFRNYSLNITLNELNESTEKQQIILYYGETCAFCKQLDEYIKSNQIDKKLIIVHKEVYFNKTNAQELMLKADECNLDKSNLAVPFLYHKGKCYIGINNCIKYLNELLNKA